MQAAMHVAQRHCSAELERYGQCVASNPTDWQHSCHNLKVQLAQCTSTHPAIRRIRLACSPEFSAFEACLEKHPGDVLHCQDFIQAFVSCAERVDVTSGTVLQGQS
uniref:Coiled-coil-helix-coiled-coil-helix domain containing 5 n=1 Tax=Eptatretus burgeri TaxID=7764 RepID=A0A8C4R5Y7_EPTBU